MKNKTMRNLLKKFPSKTFIFLHPILGPILLMYIPLTWLQNSLSLYETTNRILDGEAPIMVQEL